ncbi:MAG: GtrA family protein [Dehalococcoidia bacterium]
MNQRAARELLEPAASLRGDGALRRVLTFAAIGSASTAAFALLYAALREVAPPLVANALALVLTMGTNFLANRRYTFQVRGGSLLTHAIQYVVAYGLGLGGSTLALAIGLAIAQDPGRISETGIALAAGLVATVTRYVLLSVWVFRTPNLMPHVVPEVPQ